MLKAVKNYLLKAKAQQQFIPAERKKLLLEIADYIHTKRENNQEINLNFICTHNSRRRHLGQIWAGVIAHFFKIDGVNTFSGGTEVTAFNPRAVAALQRAGLLIKQKAESQNPVYVVKFDEALNGFECFSKVYDDVVNPKENFAALMTCSQAEAECPLILGAEKRFSLHYEDPKNADDTPEEQQCYDDRSLQIAAELFFVFNNI